MNIPQGTILFRCSPDATNIKPRECSDTGKFGTYFGDRAIISLAMCLEYNKLMQLGVYRVTEDIYVSNDKYAFREINPERYYDINGNFIIGVNPTKEENISHIKSNLILLSQSGKLLSDQKQRELNGSEIFITNKHIHKIKRISIYVFDKDFTPLKLLNYMIQNDYPFDINTYKKDKILKRIPCLFNYFHDKFAICFP